MFFCRGPTYYPMRLFRYDQVLTGVLPYDDSNMPDMITRIRDGRRPSRPTDPSRNQWLQDRVWDTITTCWSGKPERRYQLSIVYRVFLKYGRRNSKLGNLNTCNDNLMIAERSPTLKQGGGSLESSSHESPLSSSFCEIRSQKLRELLAKWIRQVIPPSSRFQS